MDEKKKSVDQYLVKHKNWQQELDLLRALLLEAKLEETIKWGAPVYMMEGKNLIGLGAFKNYVGLWFFQGGLLKDKNNVLVNAQEGRTQAMRQWRFTTAEEIDTELVKEYLSEAIANQKAGKEIKPQKAKKLDLPPALSDVLIADNNIHSCFYRLSPYKQREFAEYITEAKRETTKASRLEKIKPMILAGIGLHDKYRKC